MSSGFWAAKIRSEMPAPLPPPTVSTVAPGSWWQGTDGDGLQPDEVQQTVPQQYLPAEAQSTTHTERCPRCGSADYAEFAMDVSMGGTIPPQLGAVTKRCFECRYPAYNPSGDVIRGKGITPSSSDMAYRNVRQSGDPRNGSWGGAATFDSATKIL
jgi:hypothetical protein